MPPRACSRSAIEHGQRDEYPTRVLSAVEPSGARGGSSVQATRPWHGCRRMRQQLHDRRHRVSQHDRPRLPRRGGRIADDAPGKRVLRMRERLTGWKLRRGSRRQPIAPDAIWVNGQEHRGLGGPRMPSTIPGEVPGSHGRGRSSGPMASRSIPGTSSTRRCPTTRTASMWAVPRGPRSRRFGAPRGERIPRAPHRQHLPGPETDRDRAWEVACAATEPVG